MISKLIQSNFNFIQKLIQKYQLQLDVFIPINILNSHLYYLFKVLFKFI